MMDSRVEVTVEGGVAEVRLRRPDKMNALDIAMFHAIADAADALAARTDVRCVVLSGEGRGFCAGIDLAALATSPELKNLLPRSHGEANLFQHIAWGWRQLPVPVIAAVQGVAFGAGCQLMLGADLRIASPTADISLMEMRWGMVPDVAGFALLRGLVRDVGRALDRWLNPAVVAIKSMELPVVTAVRGAAAGVGCGLALSGDIIVCGEGAYFFFAFRHVGLLPDGGSSYLLSRAIGRVRAMDVMLRGKKIPAAQALDWGLITEMVADDAVEETAMAIARELAAGPRSLAFIKQQGWSALDDSLESALSSERLFQRQACRSEDFAEGVTAFLDKRKPQFKGR